MPAKSIGLASVAPVCPWCHALQSTDTKVVMIEDGAGGQRQISGWKIIPCNACGASMRIRLAVKRIRGERRPNAD